MDREPSLPAAAPPPALSPPPPLPPPPPPIPRGYTPPFDTGPAATRLSKHSKIRYRSPSGAIDEDDIEDVHKYVPGGYHPVDIDDEIDEYTVIHKLGSGGFATVWLVRSCKDSQYYALKVLCADAPEKTVNERRILERLGCHSHPGVVKLFRAFDITGPNGVHTCLVLPVFGPSLFCWSFSRTFTPGARYRIAQQIASAVAFLHEHGVAHADLTSSNVVFHLPDFQSMSSDAVRQLLGPPMTEKLKLRDGTYSNHGPRRIVKPVDFKGFNIGMTSAAITLIDLGEAFLLDAEHPRTGLGVPIMSFPPEVCFGISPSAGSDVWELACLLFATFCDGRPLFPLIFHSFEMLLGLIVECVGTLPRGWKGHFRAEQYGHWQDHQLIATPDGATWWFEPHPNAERSNIRSLVKEVIATKKLDMTEDQHEFLASLMQDMLVCEPGERILPREVLRRLDSAAHLFSGDVAEMVQECSYGSGNPDAPPPPPPLEPYSDSDSD